jgi:AraC-like DNA-binding protein
MARKHNSSTDVAQLAGVSRATVSYVLNATEGKSISPETRRHVVEAAQQLGYRSNRLSEGILRERTSLVGIVIPRIDHSFYSSILQGIHAACADQNFHVLLTRAWNEQGQEPEQISRLIESRAVRKVQSDDKVPQGYFRYAFSWCVSVPAQALLLSDGSTCYLPLDGTAAVRFAIGARTISAPETIALDGKVSQALTVSPEGIAVPGAGNFSRPQGTVAFWVKPAWNSADLSSGTHTLFSSENFHVTY